ncbi:MAG: hypothetical protein LUH17_05230 [Acidaminococcaceae bacterium]|nr:hypothetical protein [Acidaminococcaceae bacterium]
MLLKSGTAAAVLQAVPFFTAAATTGLKGRETMIDLDPQTVTNRELAALALQAKGRSTDCICTGRQAITRMFMTIIT